MHVKPMIGAILYATVCVTGLLTLGRGADDAKAGSRATLTSTHATAPNFVGVKAWLNSGPLNIADLRGKVVVLNFWASWCPPCLEETQSLNTLQQNITSRGGVVLGISVDEDKDAYEKFLVDNHVIFPTYRDATKKTATNYGTSMFPETYLIDRQGRLARKIVGPQDWQSPEVMRSIDTLLKQN